MHFYLLKYLNIKFIKLVLVAVFITIYCAIVIQNSRAAQNGDLSTPRGDISCYIQINQSQCIATVQILSSLNIQSLIIKNITTGESTSATSVAVNDRTDFRVVYGLNTISLIGDGKVYQQSNVWAECDTGLRWDGTNCVFNTPTPTSTLSLGEGSHYVYSNKSTVFTDEIFTVTAIAEGDVRACSRWSRISGTNQQANNSGENWSSGSDFYKPEAKLVKSVSNTKAMVIDFFLSCEVPRTAATADEPSDGSAGTRGFIRQNRTVTVRVIPRPVVSATITAPNCTISTGSSTCPITISWNIENATKPNVENVTTDSKYGTVARNPGSRVSLTHGPNTIEARSSSTVLETVTPRATCATGSTWNGARCLRPNPNADIVAPDCTIPLGAATCPIRISWTIRNAQNPNVYNQTRQASYGTVAVNAGSQVSLTHGPNVILARSGNTVLDTTTADATCIDGTAWNGTLCARIIPTATIAATPCVIPTGSSTCLSLMDWNIRNATAPNVRNRTRDVIHSIAPTATDLPRTLTYGPNVIQARDNTTILASVTATATCARGSDWNGTRCLRTADPDGTLTGTGVCTVPLGASSCDGSITWNVTNPVSPRLVRSGNPSTQIATTPSGTRTIEDMIPGRETRTFVLFDGTDKQAHVSLRAQCALVRGVRAVMRGGVCQEPLSVPEAESNLRGVDCVIPENGSQCTSRLGWDFKNTKSTPRVVNQTTNQNYYRNDAATLRVSPPLGLVNHQGETSIDVTSFDGTLEELTTVTVTSRCAGGTDWNGTRCIKSGDPDPRCPGPTCPNPDPRCPGPTCPTTDPLTIELSATSNLVRSGERATITWVITPAITGYTCTLNGPGIEFRIRTTDGTTQTLPIENKSLYTLTCANIVTGVEVSDEIVIEVVPRVQEV